MGFTVNLWVSSWVYEPLGPIHRGGIYSSDHPDADQSQFDAIVVAHVTEGKSREAHHHWNGVPVRVADSVATQQTNMAEHGKTWQNNGRTWQNTGIDFAAKQV